MKVEVKIDPVAGNLLKAGAGGTGLSVGCEDVQDCVGGAFDQGLLYDDVGNKFKAKLSSTAGNTIVFGVDGGLYSQPGAVTLGCGLTTSGGAITINGVSYAVLTRRGCDDAGDSAPVPLAGPNTGGQGIYCDDNGVLRTKPEKFTVSRQASLSENYTPALSVPFAPLVLTLAITNPSAYYCLCGSLVLACEFSMDSTIDADPQLNFLYDLDGDGVLDSTATVWSQDTRGVSGTTRQHQLATKVVNVCLDPGESKTISFQPSFLYGYAHSGGFSSLNLAAREIRFVGGNV
ncbi:MAG: hypothetical protein LC792_15445 [Actinobacteria bacterium]|nr:hypothetical protein [Actinomycetota bacterium]